MSDAIIRSLEKLGHLLGLGMSVANGLFPSPKAF